MQNLLYITIHIIIISVFILVIYFWEKLTRFTFTYKSLRLWFDGLYKKIARMSYGCLITRRNFLLCQHHTLSLSSCYSSSRMGSMKQSLKVESLDFVYKGLRHLGQLDLNFNKSKLFALIFLRKKIKC